MIREWIKNKSKIFTECKKVTRFRISPKTQCSYPEIDEAVLVWLLEKRDQGFCVNGTMIRRQALIISKTDS